MSVNNPILHSDCAYSIVNISFQYILFQHVTHLSGFINFSGCPLAPKGRYSPGHIDVPALHSTV